MIQHTATSTNKAIGRLFVAAVASGMVIGSALSSAPAAHATCASFFGIGNSADCTSTPTSIAIAVGAGARAYAKGVFGAAVALGDGSLADVLKNSFFDSAMAIGTGHGGGAESFGIAAMSLAVGPGSISLAGLDLHGTNPAFQNPIGNVAINVSNNKSGDFSYAEAIGVGNTSINLGGSSTAAQDTEAFAAGVFNTAVNLLGSGNLVYNNENEVANGWVANLMFNAFGSGNTVTSGPGPFSIAGSLFQNGVTVNKTGPGFNINGIKIGGAAAPTQKAASAPAAKTGKPAAAAGGIRKAHAAAAAPKHAGKG
jgi:hypothetical protein